MAEVKTKRLHIAGNLGGSGGATDGQIMAAVEEYFESNPIETPKGDGYYHIEASVDGNILRIDHKASSPEMVGLPTQFVKLPIGITSWNDLTDKPFGEEGNGAIIEWDGNTEGRGMITFDGQPFDGPSIDGETCYYYKISDLTPTFDELMGGQFEYSDGSGTTLDEKIWVEQYDGTIAVMGTFFVFYKTEFSVDESVISVPSTGIYAVGTPSGSAYLRKLSYGSTDIKTIDEKFIPDTIARVNPTAAELLIEILSNSQYVVDQSANIATLAEMLDVVGTRHPDSPDEPDAPEIPDTPDTPVGAAYSIRRNITNATGFDDSETIAEGDELLECYISNDECTMNGATATVTMGGEDITSTAWDNGVVNIPEVTGDVVIDVSAVKINYVVPPMEDFTLQLFENTKLLVKGYTGTAKAVELPAVFTYNGKEYPLVASGTPVANSAVLYVFGLNANVEHLKHPLGGFPGVSSSVTPNFRTVDAEMNGSIYPVQNLTKLEKIPTASADGAAFRTADNSSYSGCTSIRTVRNVAYPDAQTSLQWLYHNCTGLVDGGVIPAQITDIKNLFYGCTNLRRVRFEGKTFTDTNNWFYGVANLELECHLDSDIYGNYDPPIGWTYKAIDGTPIHRILCFGDSLSENTYERTLANLCPVNAMVNPLGNGGYRSDQIYQKMTNGTYDKLLKDGIIVIWHGTNGYGSDGYDGVTAKMVAALNGNQRFLLIPPTYQGVGGEVYESWVATYGAEHVLSIGDWFKDKGYTVSSYQTDATHFTSDGYALAAQAIYEKISHWL